MADTKTITLLDKNGNEFQTDNLGTANSLVMAHGYRLKGKAKLEDLQPAEELPVEKPAAKK